MELFKFQSLLQQVASLNERYKKINELSGENFNVFRMLKLEASEVRMHSAFLAELLNPNGSHGQKDVFLKLFAEMFCFKLNDYHFESCKTEIEKHTAFLNEDRSEGGRIDIIVTDKSNCCIIIENKIYAGDQEKQLLRYYNFSNTADLFYLTLDGKEPGDQSRGGLENGVDYRCLSYKHDIITWLEKCRKEVAILPVIRETITQYINLIKYLTNQTLNDTMNAELSSLILSNLESSFIIADNLDKALEQLLSRLNDELQEVAGELGLGYSNNVNFDKNYSGFWFGRKEWKYVSIGFQFQAYDKGLVYGFTRRSEIKDIPAGLKLTFGELAKGIGRQSSWWPIYIPFNEENSNWGKFEVWKDIAQGRMKVLMREKIIELMKLTQGMEL